MKAFSDLRVFVLLGIIFLLAIRTVDAQEPFLEVLGSEGFDGTANVGDTLVAIFQAGFNGQGQAGIPLNITATPNIKVTSPSPVPGTHRTGPGGVLTVRGTIAGDTDGYIQADWPDEQLSARIHLNVVEPGHAPVIIVVNPPDPKSPLTVGDTFTQDITIENWGFRWTTLPISAWQMEIVFDPLILKVVEVIEGDFLESDGNDAFYTQVISEEKGRISVTQTRAGQELNPTPLGVSLAPGDKGELLRITFRVLAFAEEVLGIHKVKIRSSEDFDENGIPDRISYKIMIDDLFVATHRSSVREDVNQDAVVDLLDLVMVAGSIGAAQPNLRADVNDDDVIDVSDLVAIAGSAHWGQRVRIVQVREPNAAAPAASVLNLMPEMIRGWIALAKIKNDGSLLFQRGIANLEGLLAASVPSETLLLLNYPNPFNPETWIPYQLSEPADVSVSIYAVDGRLVRRLDLGHQSAGVYRSRSRAAYWDGRNEFGERVASGLYFYTLTAGDFTATRKMLIRK